MHSGCPLICWLVVDRLLKKGRHSVDNKTEEDLTSTVYTLVIKSKGIIIHVLSTVNVALQSCLISIFTQITSSTTTTILIN